MSCSLLEEMTRKITSLEADLKAAWATNKATENARQEEMRKRDAAEAKLDAIMLEYCPEEMTKEQKIRWAQHQKPISKSEMKEIEAALNRDKEL